MKYIVILVISNMIFCSSLFCQEPAKCQVPVMDTLVKAKDTIKKQKPNIPDEQLDYDIFSIANTFPKLCPAYGKFNREEATEVLAAVWIDIRTKEKLKAGESVGPAVSNNYSGYGLLKVQSEPTGAMIILDEDQIWEEKTNTERGVVSGMHTIELKLSGFKTYETKVHVPYQDVAMVRHEFRE